MILCPRDQQILASNDVSGYRYYSCEQCHGFWIPGAALHRVLSESSIVELRAVPRASPSEVPCPDCRAAADALMVEECRLDLCPRCHGVWLDPGEAHRLRRLFPEGSAVVMADATSQEIPPPLVACSAVDAVANLLLLILP